MSIQIIDPTREYSAYQRGDYLITTDPARLDVDAIHSYLSRSYWANTRTRDMVELSLRHSLNFGLYHAPNAHAGEHDGGQGGAQVGLARIVTDYATFAYLCDVYVLEDHRGQGLGKWLIETMLNDPTLKNIVRFTLATRDAHGLYARFGFATSDKPENRMEYSRTV
jgi:GNAT superfamily N-acetyltransferase